MRKVFVFALLFVVSPIWAKVTVVTSTTDIAWAAKKIGKKLITVSPLLTGKENPHFLDARPDFIHRVANADIVCSVGLDLEVGWLPKVMARSGNSSVRTGGKGNCVLGNRIQVLEKPQGKINRSMGDVHPAGNPHFWLSPTQLGIASEEIKEALIRVDPAHSSQYQQGYKELRTLLSELSKQNKVKFATLLKSKKNLLLMEYHREFVYFLNEYGLKSAGAVEEKPGVPPSAGRLAQVAEQAKKAGVELVIAASYSPPGKLKKFSELSDIPVFQFTTSIARTGDIADYVKWQNYIVDSIIRRLSKKKVLSHSGLGETLVGSRH